MFSTNTVDTTTIYDLNKPIQLIDSPNINPISFTTGVNKQ